MCHERWLWCLKNLKIMRTAENRTVTKRWDQATLQQTPPCSIDQQAACQTVGWWWYVMMPCGKARARFWTIPSVVVSVRTTCYEKDWSPPPRMDTVSINGIARSSLEHSANGLSWTGASPAVSAFFRLEHMQPDAPSNTWVLSFCLT